MSCKLQKAWRAVFNLSDYINLPDPIKDRAIAKFLRHQRPDLFNMDFAGDCLLWYMGIPRPAKEPENRPPDNPLGLRMSDQLWAAVSDLISGTDLNESQDPTWKALLILRGINESAFDLSVAGDSLAYFLAGLDMQSEAE